MLSKSEKRKQALARYYRRLAKMTPEELAQYRRDRVVYQQQRWLKAGRKSLYNQHPDVKRVIAYQRKLYSSGIRVPRGLAAATLDVDLNDIKAWAHQGAAKRESVAIPDVHVLAVHEQPVPQSEP